MNIVYTCQDNYAQIVGVSIYSLLKNNKNEQIHIYFLDSGLSDDSKKELRKLCFSNGNAEIDFFSVSALLEQYSEKLTAFQNNFATYAKLFMELLLPKNIDECLYIDADTLVLENLKSVFENKNDFTLYMGYDVVFPKHKELIGLDSVSPYFNAGVIFVNLRRWRKKEYTEKILNHLCEGHSYVYGDQDIFNVLFKDDIGKIGFENNVITQFCYYKSAKICRFVYGVLKKSFYTKEEFKINKASIVHFTTYPFMIRPWFSKSTHLYAEVYKKFVKESPYCNMFEYKEMNEPARRRLIQFFSKGKRNFIVPFIIGSLLRKFKA